MSVNDARGPSVDAVQTTARAKKRKAPVQERLAHRGCNTGKGATAAVVPWPEHLFVVDPAAILPTVDRLTRKGGREIVARCPTEDDAQDAVDWLVDRLSRLAPELVVEGGIEEGGGQHLVVLVTR